MWGLRPLWVAKVGPMYLPGSVLTDTDREQSKVENERKEGREGGIERQ